MPLRGPLATLVLVTLLHTVTPARAQPPAGQRPPAPYTLTPWADGVWLALTDRDGSYFGRLAEQGTLQRFNPLMDDEYELDLRTGLFGGEEDARWASVRRGLRVAGASINHPFILNFIDWRESLPISGPVDLVARYRRQRSLTAQRDYPMVGLAWRDALGSSWTLGAAIGMHFFKSSADVELGMARTWTGPGTNLALDVRVAFLDAFNNVIFNALGVEPKETRAHFDYRRLPLAARAAVIWAAGDVRVEAHAGSSTRTRVDVTFPATREASFRQDERVTFAGAQTEVRYPTGSLVAIYLTTARAETERRFASTPSRSDFRLRERTHTLGVRGAARLDTSVDLEVGAERVWRPEDLTPGDGSFTERHRDRETFAHLAVVRRPPVGWTWRLGYSFDDRSAGVFAPWLTATNHRQLMEGGHRFRSGFDLTVGVRWDLDRGPANPFDGGHLRFSATW